MLGLGTRAAAAIVIFSMSSTHGWAIELNALFITLALALIFLGGGSYALEARFRARK